MALGAGHVVCWHNVVHWGGLCGARAATPRVSLAATFRRPDAPKTHLVADDASLDDVLDFAKLANDPAGAVDPADRARLVANALLMYADWYDLDGGALPAAFPDLLGAARPSEGPPARRAHRGGPVVDASGCLVEDY